MIPYGKHHINKNDIDSVLNVLKSNFLTQGPQVPRFEKIVSKYCNSKYGLAVNSATSALHIACLALGLKKVIDFGQRPTHLLRQLIVVYIVEAKLTL